MQSTRKIITIGLVLIIGLFVSGCLDSGGNTVVEDNASVIDNLTDDAANLSATVDNFTSIVTETNVTVENLTDTEVAQLENTSN